MKIRVKRALCMLLAMIMLMGMCVTSYAAEKSDSVNSQPVLRGPAAPITSVTLDDDEWDKSGRCFVFVIKEMGIGPYTVDFNGKKLKAEKSVPILGADRSVIGWYIHFRSQRIYGSGTYKMVATFYSNNGTEKVWTLKNNFVVTEDMLP